MSTTAETRIQPFIEAPNTSDALIVSSESSALAAIEFIELCNDALIKNLDQLSRTEGSIPSLPSIEYLEKEVIFTDGSSLELDITSGKSPILTIGVKPNQSVLLAKVCVDFLLDDESHCVYKRIDNPQDEFDHIDDIIIEAEKEAPEGDMPDYVEKALEEEDYNFMANLNLERDMGLLENTLVGIDEVQRLRTFLSKLAIV